MGSIGNRSVRPPRTRRPAAVAVAYESGVLPAPLIIASGEGRLAEEIISLARQHDVPVQEDPWLVAALLRVRPGTFVPPELYQAIAELLAFLYTVDAEAVPTAGIDEIQQGLAGEERLTQAHPGVIVPLP